MPSVQPEPLHCLIYILVYENSETVVTNNNLHVCINYYLRKKCSVCCTSHGEGGIPIQNSGVVYTVFDSSAYRYRNSSYSNISILVIIKGYAMNNPIIIALIARVVPELNTMYATIKTKTQ